MDKRVLILISVIVVALVAGGVVFMMLQKPQQQAVTSTQSTASTKNSTTTPSTTTATKIPTTLTWKATGTAVAGKFADADTVKLADGGYRMYYGVQPEVAGNHLEIYSATSADGVSWKQESGTRKTMATFPDVVKLADGTFRMYFQSAGVIKSATSTDGLSFTDESSTRIDTTNDLGVTFDNVAAPTVLFQSDGTYLMVYRGTIKQQYGTEPTPNKDTQILLWATSTDGLSWTKKGVAVDSRNTTLYGLADGPELFTADDGTVTVSFWSYTGVYWSKVSSGSFSTPEKVFALVEGTPQNKFPAETPGDPVYAKFGNTWYMYYGRPDGINYAVGTVK